MKKTFGIIFLVLGIILGIAGLMMLTDHSGSYSYDGGDFGGMSYHSSAAQERELTGGVLGLFGIIFFIIGIVMVSTKSKSQKEKEADLKVLKNMQQKETVKETVKVNEQPGNELQILAKQGTNFYTQKNYTAAAAIFKSLCMIEPSNPKWYYDLACVQSLNQDLEAMQSLAKAKELGYSNTEKFHTDSDLNWLRTQPGFKDIAGSPEKSTSSSSQNTNTQEKSKPLDQNMIDQLEKLGRLRESGILTDEEFQDQKKRILNK